MCTFVLLRRPGHAWPLLIAANRDEMAGRAALPPGRHWPDRPDVLAGRDQLSGGTWLGINDRRTVAGVLNRPGTLGPVADRRSRGELPLEALDHGDARAAAEALAHLSPRAYRPFNLVVADPADAFLVCGLEAGNGAGPRGRIEVWPIPDGVSMVTARGMDARGSARARRFGPLFRAARAPDPATGDWREWADLLARRDHDPEAGPDGAMCVVTEGGFGTVSASLIAIPAPLPAGRGAVWLYADGRPGEAEFAVAGRNA